MANKRMIAKEMLESDDFTSMSANARLLYVYMVVYADDDGIVDNPKNIVRMAQAVEGDIKQLIENELVIPLGNKLLIVRDWLRFNKVQPSRYKPSVYAEAIESICVINGRYVCRQNVDKLSRSIEQYRLEQNSIDKYRAGAREDIKIHTVGEWREKEYKKTRGKSKNNNNGFNQFQQREDYDYKQLEMELACNLSAPEKGES